MPWTSTRACSSAQGPQPRSCSCRARFGHERRAGAPWPLCASSRKYVAPLGWWGPHDSSSTLVRASAAHAEPKRPSADFRATLRPKSNRVTSTCRESMRSRRNTQNGSLSCHGAATAAAGRASADEQVPAAGGIFCTLTVNPPTRAELLVRPDTHSAELCVEVRFPVCV